MNIQIDEISKVIFKLNENTILNTNHALNVGESINFYDNENQVIQLKRENNTLKIELKINKIRSCYKKRSAKKAN